MLYWISAELLILSMDKYCLLTGTLVIFATLSIMVLIYVWLVLSWLVVLDLPYTDTSVSSTLFLVLILAHFVVRCFCLALSIKLVIDW